MQQVRFQIRPSLVDQQQLELLIDQAIPLSRFFGTETLWGNRDHIWFECVCTVDACLLKGGWPPSSSSFELSLFVTWLVGFAKKINSPLLVNGAPVTDFFDVMDMTRGLR